MRFYEALVTVVSMSPCYRASQLLVYLPQVYGPLVDMQGHKLLLLY